MLSIRQHTEEEVQEEEDREEEQVFRERIRPHTSAYVRIRQHTDLLVLI